MSARLDPIQQATVALMDSLTDQTEWTESRIGLFDSDDQLISIIPSNTHYGAIRALCKRFHLTDRIVKVQVSFKGE